MLTKADIEKFKPPTDQKDPIFKVELWRGPCDLSDRWVRTYCKVYDNLVKAKAGFKNKSTCADHLRVLYQLIDGQWSELDKEIYPD